MLGIVITGKDLFDWHKSFQSPAVGKSGMSTTLPDR